EMGIRKLQRRIKKLVKGAGYTQDEIQALEERIDLRPQQGFSLTSQAALDGFRKAVEKHRANIVVLDSFTALQNGDENNNTERRAFLNRVVAMTKAETGCAFVLL